MTLGYEVRQRVSSQCQKAWLRESNAWVSLAGELGMTASYRTPGHFGPAFTARLSDAGIDDAEKWSDAAAKLFGSKDASKAGDGAAPRIFGYREIDLIAEACVRLSEQGDAPSALEAAMKKSPLNDPSIVGLDGAVFGRMSTAKTIACDIRSAFHVADAIATHEYLPIDDFWSAQDQNPEKAGHGAGHIGDRELAAPSVFLRHAVIDLRQLEQNLGGVDVEMVAGRMVSAFLRAFTNSGATARASYARTLEASVCISHDQVSMPIDAVRESRDDPAEIWAAIQSQQRAEFTDYGTPDYYAELAECRGGESAAIDVLGSRVNEALRSLKVN
jgi:hypothetical protein